ncbi:MAG: hypothetical protein WC365_00470 [Candidatus Babeliales bacterium]|jgi:hypothetical protein
MYLSGECLICQATELKEGLFGQEEYSFTDGTIKDYTFRQFDIKEFIKTRTITIPEQLKTPLQEFIEEFAQWKKENIWGKNAKKESYLKRIIGYIQYALFVLFGKKYY